MPGKRHTTEQKIRILREAEAVGKTVLAVCREHRISEQTFHRWKREFGMLEVDQAKQLKELKKENERLKRMLADEMLGKELLKEALEKSCEPRAQASGRPVACATGALYGPHGVPSLRPSPQHVQVPGQGAGFVAGEAEDGVASDVACPPGVGLPQDR